MKKYLLVAAMFTVSLSTFAHENYQWEKKFGNEKKWNQNDKCRHEEYGRCGKREERNNHSHSGHHDHRNYGGL